MLVNDSLYQQYTSLLPALHCLQSDHDRLVQQNIPLVINHAIKTQIEVTKARLETITDQLIYSNPFSGERELPVDHELFELT